jgi:hypothetical protein
MEKLPQVVRRLLRLVIGTDLAMCLDRDWAVQLALVDPFPRTFAMALGDRRAQEQASQVSLGRDGTLLSPLSLVVPETTIIRIGFIEIADPAVIRTPRRIG